MIYQVKRMVLIAMIGFCAVDVVMADSDYEGLKHISEQIVTKMPGTWRIAQEKSGVIPYGHYDGLKYEGPRGLSLVLEGGRDVCLHWKDKMVLGIRSRSPRNLLKYG